MSGIDSIVILAVGGFGLFALWFSGLPERRR